MDEDLARLLGAAMGAQHTVTPTEQGTYEHTWTFASGPPPRFPGFIVAETEQALAEIQAAQAWLRTVESVTSQIHIDPDRSTLTVRGVGPPPTPQIEAGLRRLWANAQAESESGRDEKGP
jgi:hypothetical protein